MCTSATEFGTLAHFLAGPRLPCKAVLGTQADELNFNMATLGVQYHKLLPHMPIFRSAVPKNFVV